MNQIDTSQSRRAIYMQRFDVLESLYCIMTRTTVYLLLAICAAASALDLEAVYTEEELMNTDKSILEDARFNFTQLATKYGYPSEIHTVETEDGYFLTVHRIPYGRACGEGKGKIPVLVQHGLFCSSDDFIVLGPEEGLGYLLADQCYDVWLSNSRGNKYSRKHRTINIKSGKFWEFSWHEMGVYDLPAVIDYILKATGEPKLHYIGHSQGTTQFFVYGSLRPEHLSKIRSVQALSPVAIMKNLNSPALKILSLFHKPLHTIAGLINMHELLPTCEFLNLIGRQLCQNKFPALQAICQNVLFLIAGTNPHMINATKLPIIIGHTPAGASLRQIVHYAQGILVEGFKHYDHGWFVNILKYGSISPPSYPVDKITAPVIAYYSENDWMANVNDIHKFLSLLPNVVAKFKVPNRDFGHLEFMWGLGVKNLVYDKMFNMMKRF